MALQTLLQQHGITTIEELIHRSGLSRPHSWNLRHEYAGVGKATALRPHKQLGIPLEELIQVDPVPAVKRPCPTPSHPRGRPRKTSAAPEAAEDRSDRFCWTDDGDLVKEDNEEGMP